MSSKSMNSQSVRNAEEEGERLPEIAAARSELARRYLRSVVSLLVRLVAVALFCALLVAQVPALRQIRWLLDMISGSVVLWPFFTSVGRIYGWRITLGRQYVEREQWDAAAQILAPIEGWRARFFDATGEGVYWRAVALEGMGRRQEATSLFAALAQAQSVWGQKAQVRLQEQRQVTP